MAKSVDQSHIDFLRLECARLRFEAEAFKEMVRAMNQVVVEGQKLIRATSPSHTSSPRVAATALVGATLRALPSWLQSRLPEKVRAFSAPKTHRSCLVDLVVSLQQQLQDLKIRTARAIADCRRAENALSEAGVQIMQA